MEIWHTLTQWTQEPVRLWHLMVFAIPFGITLSNMQKQIAAVAKGVISILDKVDPEN